MRVPQRVSYAWMMLMLLATGCAAFAPAKSFEQKMAYAYGVHTAVLQSAANAVTAGTLSAKDGETVLQMADESKQFLDAARMAAASGNLSTAEGQLALATNILSQLQIYLNTRGK